MRRCALGPPTPRLKFTTSPRQSVINSKIKMKKEGVFRRHFKNALVIEIKLLKDKFCKNLISLASIFKFTYSYAERI